MHTELILASGLLGLLVFALGFNVSLQRNKSREGVSVGTDPKSPLLKANRAHANAAEYNGVLIALFVVIALVYRNRDLGLLATSLVGLVTLARFSHAFGMLTCKSLNEKNPFRFAGALITYLAGAAICLLLIVKAI